MPRSSSGDGSGAVAFSAAAAGCAELGAIVEQHALLEALQQRLQQRGVTQLQPATVVQERRCAGSMVLPLDDGSQLSATFVIDADGAQSPLRQRLGFATRSWRHGQDATITTLRTSPRRGATAYQRFTGHGPLALLPPPALPRSGPDAGKVVKLALAGLGLAVGIGVVAAVWRR